MTDTATGLTMIGRQEVELPEVLDLLVVGGGPGGTAAAFRAVELGLSVLVIDYDDILKRIRDYSKDKLILPDFGGGDLMKFPLGGELVSRLRFEPIDKDAMHRTWKACYRDFHIPVRVGVELCGVDREPGGTLVARTYDHGERRDRSFRCRHLVLAIGRGVPRRFDIPGDTDGIAFRLDDAERYVGRPACVIGGGTSAAEAVIAVSAAKAAAEDPTPVYWSYRGDRLPRVSKALAEVFFEAYLGNGNIRYQPKSEPVAVVVGDDRRHYLSIRVDRREMAGRPTETVHFEIPKEDVIACIGEDLPEALLNSLGIAMVTGGPKLKKRMCVTPLLETCQPGVYMIGDILSQVHLETDDFAADPASFREVKHRGNVKSALRDGVFVAEVIAQRLAGREEVRVELRDAPDPPSEASVEGLFVAASPAPPAPPASPPPAGPRPAAIDEVAAGFLAAEERGRLVRLLPGEVEDRETPLPAEGRLTIGRGDCDLAFPDDAMLSERHAAVAAGPDGVFLHDEGGRSGVFLRARAGEHVELPEGGLVRAGRSFLVHARGAEGPELRQYDHQGKERGVHPVGERSIVLGREAPDVVLDADDLSLSRRHLAVRVDGQRLLVKDLRSVNGTYLRVSGAVELTDGDELRVGRQHFRYITGATSPAPAAPIPPVAPVASAAPPRVAAAPPPPPVPTPSRAAAGEPSVTFQPGGETFAVKPGQTLCDVAEEHGFALNAECHAGICGSDPLRILSGGEFLSPLGDQESETLEELCDLEPGPCRLACMAKVTGPVVVERIG